MDLLSAAWRFKRDESGAVTTDWVLLVALVMTMGVGLMISIGSATADSTETVMTAIKDRGIPTY